MDDIEEQLQINHLGHFLLCSLLLPDMQKAKDPRMIIVGSITGTVTGSVMLCGSNVMSYSSNVMLYGTIP